MTTNPIPRNVQQTAAPGHAHNFEHRHELSAKGIQAYRARMLQLCPQFSESHVTQFVQSCFSSPEMIIAYCLPLHLPVVVAVSGRPLVAEALPDSQFQARQTVSIIPFQAALNAGHRARDMKILQNESDLHKRLSALATILSPCGLFLINHPTLGPGSLLGETVAQAARRYQRKALGHALAVLNERAPDAGKFLSFTLGFPFQGGVASQPASKMVVAVTLSTLSIKVNPEFETVI